MKNDGGVQHFFDVPTLETFCRVNTKIPETNIFSFKISISALPIYFDTTYQTWFCLEMHDKTRL